MSGCGHRLRRRLLYAHAPAPQREIDDHAPVRDSREALGLHIPPRDRVCDEVARRGGDELVAVGEHEALGDVVQEVEDL